MAVPGLDPGLTWPSTGRPHLLATYGGARRPVHAGQARTSWTAWMAGSIPGSSPGTAMTRGEQAWASRFQSRTLPARAWACSPASSASSWHESGGATPGDPRRFAAATRYAASLSAWVGCVRRQATAPPALRARRTRRLRGRDSHVTRAACPSRGPASARARPSHTRTRTLPLPPRCAGLPFSISTPQRSPRRDVTRGVPEFQRP